MLSAWRRAVSRPSVVGRAAASAAATQQWRGFAAAAAATAGARAVAVADQPPLRTAADKAAGKPKILDRAATNAKQHATDVAELRAHITANKQTLPLVAQTVERTVREVKPKNKKESKLFAHLRRMRLTRQRELFPAAPRPYFAPIRVNHTPKRVHAEAAQAQADAAPATKVTARLNALIARTAATAAITAADTTAAVESTAAAAANGSAAPAVAADPNARFAIVDVNSKQHKVVPGDLLMVDRLAEVSVGDKLQFDRVLMVGSKTYTVLGRPLIPTARVMMTCEEQAYTKHMIVFKKHRRKGYRKTKGYRHKVTLLRVDAIDYDAAADATAQVLAPDAAPALPAPTHASAPRRVKPAAAKAKA